MIVDESVCRNFNIFQNGRLRRQLFASAHETVDLKNDIRQQLVLINCAQTFFEEQFDQTEHAPGMFADLAETQKGRAFRNLFEFAIRRVKVNDDGLPVIRLARGDGVLCDRPFAIVEPDEKMAPYTDNA